MGREPLRRRQICIDRTCQMFLQVGREGPMPKRHYVTSWNENGLRCLTACSTLDRLLFDTNIVEQEPDLYTYLYRSKNHRCVEKYQQFPDHHGNI